MFVLRTSRSRIPVHCMPSPLPIPTYLDKQTDSLCNKLLKKPKCSHVQERVPTCLQKKSQMFYPLHPLSPLLLLYRKSSNTQKDISKFSGPHLRTRPAAKKAKLLTCRNCPPHVHTPCKDAAMTKRLAVPIHARAMYSPTERMLPEKRNLSDSLPDLTGDSSTKQYSIPSTHSVVLYTYLRAVL